MYILYVRKCVHTQVNVDFIPNAIPLPITHADQWKQTIDKSIDSTRLDSIIRLEFLSFSIIYKHVYSAMFYKSTKVAAPEI